MRQNRGFKEKNIYAKLKELVEKYQLIATWRLKNVINTNILPSLLSDHSPISSSLKYIEEPIKGAGHWKLNLSLLKDNFMITLKDLHTPSAPHHDRGIPPSPHCV